MRGRVLRGVGCAVIVVGLFAAFTPSASGGAVPDGSAAACAAIGAPVQVGRVATVACTRFHPDVAIRLPEPTATVSYGYLSGRTGEQVMLETPTRSIPVQAGVGSYITDDVALAARVLVSATIRGGTVTAVRPWLYIDESAIVSVFGGRQLTGRAVTMGAPAGVRSSMWLRMAFNADGTVARIVNYSAPLRGRGACRPAILTPTSRAFVRSTLGAHGILDLSWSPAMHAPGDSEIVLTSKRGPSYMTRGPLLDELIKGPWAPTELSFAIHGNPIGSVAQISGALAARTPLVRC